MVSGHSFADSTRRYEAWLAQYCKIDDAGLAEKREKIKAAPFPFLRGTFYRWPHHFAAVEPRIAEAARILSIGDTHIENFGTWRDEEGRHAWGVNDFDEAAELPWTSDLVRLATSVILSPEAKTDAEKDLRGDCRRLPARPEDRTSPFVLEEDHPQLRDLAVVKGKAARRFWERLRQKRTPGEVPTKVQHLLLTCLPPTSRGVEFASRTAGVGSLGRPRYIALAEWEGGFVAREAKAAAPSAVHMREAEGRDQVMDHRRVRALAFQPRDPAFRLDAGMDPAPAFARERQDRARQDREAIQGRAGAGFGNARSAPDGHGAAIANVHLGTTPLRRLLRSELKGLGDDWLAPAAEAAAERVRRDFKTL